MFSAPFSFKGRIARMEYLISILISLLGIIVIILLMVALGLKLNSVFILSLLMVVAWFRMTQAAKRCHDTGVSGFYQLIPFYSLVLLVEKGNLATNKYGTSPKVSIIEELCTITAIAPDRIVVQRTDGRVIMLENVSTPKDIRKGDWLKHTGNGHYEVIDTDGNIVFRIREVFAIKKHLVLTCFMALHTGTVSLFKDDKGIGFIRPDGGGKEVLIVPDPRLRTPFKRGDRVSYELMDDPKGPRAYNVTLTSQGS